MRGKAEVWGRRLLGRCDASHWSGTFYAAQEGDCEDTD